MSFVGREKGEGMVWKDYMWEEGGGGDQMTKLGSPKCLNSPKLLGGKEELT